MALFSMNFRVEILLFHVNQMTACSFIGDKNHPEVKGIISYGKNIKVFESLD